MFRQIIVPILCVFVLVQISQSDPIDDAQAALNTLRNATSSNLNQGFLQHIQMSNDVDAAALDTKESASSADVDACVDAQADEAVSFIYNTSSSSTSLILKLVYDQEKDVVFCGRSNATCLDGVTAEIQAVVAALPSLIDAVLGSDRLEVDQQIEQIRACGAAKGKIVQII